MNDQQILTLALSIVIPLSMLIYANSRVSDLRDGVKTQIADAKEMLRAEIAALRSEMRQGFDQLESLLKAHELEHHKINLR